MGKRGYFSDWLGQWREDCWVSRLCRRRGRRRRRNPARDLTGTWQGTLHAGKDLRTVVKITKDDKSAYKAQFFSIDQGG